MGDEPSASCGAFSSSVLCVSPEAGDDEETVGAAEASGAGCAALGALWNAGAAEPPAFLNRSWMQNHTQSTCYETTQPDTSAIHMDIIVHNSVALKELA
jgi:hypothetical protein